VCHDSGTVEERAALDEAVHGAVHFTPLYWWNRKIRTAFWRRPLSEAKQIVRTTWSLGSSARVAAFAARHRADLIHTNTMLNPEGGRAAFRLGLPHVWHIRELWGPGNPFRLSREGPAFGRYAARYCSKFVANSEICAAQIRDWLPEGLLEVVPNGIDLTRFHPRPASKETGRIIIGMVGNLTSRSKKHQLFVEAASLVDRNLPIEWRVYGYDPSCDGKVAGDSYVDALHNQLARLGIVNRFRFPGYVTDQAEIMSQIDMLVHPADNESFGRIVVEAMAAGLPVVGARGGGVSEIVKHGTTGLLADPDNARDLAACIEQLARDSLRRRAMGRAGRQRAESYYSMVACRDGVLHVYEQAMTRPLGQPIALTPSAATATS
jgi:glycosyltransferase involved in cell wall biosynthesis